jgi:hypothetical protein
MEILGKISSWAARVGKELCYEKAETWEDAEEVAKWWQYKLVT